MCDGRGCWLKATALFCSCSGVRMFAWFCLNSANMSGCGEVSDCHSDSTPPMRSALGVELRQFPVRILASCLRRGLHAGGVCLFTRVLCVLHETSVHTCVTRSHFTRNQQKGGSPRPKCTLFFFHVVLLHKREKSPEPGAVGHPALKMALRCWPF